ncbi:hypothetical protein BU16DRAFT_67038 [Lophium mytilinum]|uniref:Uncharacterized protein n=1 Tax=Lophium mytilinum TaxID=390894 RepID=A0A6A6QTE4_9PEZI|nr:hypothetical protein BU16DRAFT_67038 [Lophium mytilinum]
MEESNGSLRSSSRVGCGEETEAQSVWRQPRRRDAGVRARCARRATERSWPRTCRMVQVVLDVDEGRAHRDDDLGDGAHQTTRQARGTKGWITYNLARPAELLQRDHQLAIVLVLRPFFGHPDDGPRWSLMGAGVNRRSGWQWVRLGGEERVKGGRHQVKEAAGSPKSRRQQRWCKNLQPQNNGPPAPPGLVAIPLLPSIISTPRL